MTSIEVLGGGFGRQCNGPSPMVAVALKRHPNFPWDRFRLGQQELRRIKEQEKNEKEPTCVLLAVVSEDRHSPPLVPMPAPELAGLAAKTAVDPAHRADDRADKGEAERQSRVRTVMENFSALQRPDTSDPNTE